MAEPWVFGIGEGKSGSTSLRAALEVLGLDAVHLGSPHDSETLKQVRANINTGRRITKDIAADALVEIQGSFRELDRQHPSAKFILTYRPPDDAAMSWCRQASARCDEYPAEWADYYAFAEKVRRHITEVVKHFYGRPERLLILDARDADATKWRLLASFLGLAEPPAGTPYPRVFDHQSWQT